MARTTERGQVIIKRLSSHDLRAFAVQIRKTDGPTAAACLDDAANLIDKVQSALDDEENDKD